MANRYDSEHKERKIGKGGARPSPGTGGAVASRGAIREKTANWTAAGASGGSVFTTKGFATVKTDPVRKGC